MEARYLHVNVYRDVSVRHSRLSGASATVKTHLQTHNSYTTHTADDGEGDDDDDAEEKKAPKKKAPAAATTNKKPAGATAAAKKPTAAVKEKAAAKVCVTFE